MHFLTHIRGIIYWLLCQSPLSSMIGWCFSQNIPTIHGVIKVSSTCPSKIKASILFGLYEYSECFLIKRFLPSDYNCVELGASIGIVSQSILRKINKDRKLVAVEASSINISILEVNLKKYQDRDIEIINKAVSNTESEVDFELSENNLCGRIANSGTSLNKTIKVPTIRLNDLLITKERFSLVMDIEGGEHEVIHSSTLKNCVCMIVELHGSPLDKKIFLDKTQSLGLELVGQKHTVFIFARK